MDSAYNTFIKRYYFQYKDYRQATWETWLCSFPSANGQGPCVNTNMRSNIANPAPSRSGICEYYVIFTSASTIFHNPIAFISPQNFPSAYHGKFIPLGLPSTYTLQVRRTMQISTARQIHEQTSSVS
jgi:hypothetical protein